MPTKTSFAYLLILAACWPALATAEPVVLRWTGGRFLRPAEDGRLRADRLSPTEKETFELSSRGQDRIVLRAPGGQLMTAEGGVCRITNVPAEPGDRETFVLVPSGENRFAWKALGSQQFVVLVPPAAGNRGSKSAAGPVAPQTVEIYRVAELPAILQTAIEMAVHGLAGEELKGKHYDKTRKHKTEKYVDLPAPTLHDPKRTKKHQVLGLTEEYRIQAQLDGEADVRISRIPYLKSYSEGQPGVLMFAVEARLPLVGHVQYKLADVVSASTGYRAMVHMTSVSEVRMKKSGGSISFDPPVVLDLHVGVSKLDLSNDLLEAARRPIERVINHELRQNEEPIRTKANKALQKAVHSREFHVPLLGYLGL